MLKKCFLIALFFSTATFCQAQIGGWIASQVKNNKPTLSFAIESRNSFLSERPIKLTGVKMLFNFGDFYKIGVGYYDNGIFTKPSSNLAFVGLLNDFLLYRNGKGEATASLMLDFGNFSPSQEFDSKAFVAYEVLLGGQLNFLKYFFAGAALGYRLGIINPYVKEARLSAPLYQLKIGLNFTEIARSFKK